MQKNDYVSVIIPYYNSRKWCEPLIQKLISQKKYFYKDTEIIVIDDCSTEDNSWLWLYQDDIKFLRNKTNMGVSYCRNLGLKLSKGNYIQFVDSDDDIFNNFLEIIYENITKNCDYCLYRWYSQGNITEGEIPEDSLKWNWAVWGYTFKRDCIGNEKFNEKMNTMEDYDFLKRVLKGKTRRIVDNPIYIYNSTNENSICHLIDAGKLEKTRNAEY